MSLPPSSQHTHACRLDLHRKGKWTRREASYCPSVLKQEPDAISACGENDDQRLGQRLAFVRDAMRRENVSVSCSDCTMLSTNFSAVAAFSDGGLISLVRLFSQSRPISNCLCFGHKNEFNS